MLYLKNYSLNTGSSKGMLGKVVSVAVTASLAILGFMFSAVLIVVLALAGILGVGYLWWKTRVIRKQIRDQASDRAVFGDAGNLEEDFKGNIIEGEVIREAVTRIER